MLPFIKKRNSYSKGRRVPDVEFTIMKNYSQDTDLIKELLTLAGRISDML